MTEWIVGKIIKINRWNERLFSLFIHADINPFIAGQFAKIRIDKNGEKIQRAYSYVNAPSNKDLEFYIVNIPHGKFSSLLYKMNPGEELMITKNASGFFTLKQVPACKNLWLISTGTAIGPYLSMLEDRKEIEKFDKIILVHAVRFFKDLNYLPKMLMLESSYLGKLNIKTILSRENILGSITGRITNLISNGTLEDSVNLQLDASNSHVMLCGNPKMVKETQELLTKKYKMKQNLRTQKGNITIENYW